MAVLAAKYDIHKSPKDLYSAMVYISGKQIVAEYADGKEIKCGTDAATVLQAAANAANIKSIYVLNSGSEYILSSGISLLKSQRILSDGATFDVTGLDVPVFTFGDDSPLTWPVDYRYHPCVENINIRGTSSHASCIGLVFKRTVNFHVDHFITDNINGILLSGECVGRINDAGLFNLPQNGYGIRTEKGAGDWGPNGTTIENSIIETGHSGSIGIYCTEGNIFARGLWIEQVETMIKIDSAITGAVQIDNSWLLPHTPPGASDLVVFNVARSGLTTPLQVSDCVISSSIAANVLVSAYPFLFDKNSIYISAGALPLFKISGTGYSEFIGNKIYGSTSFSGSVINTPASSYYLMFNDNQVVSTRLGGIMFWDTASVSRLLRFTCNNNKFDNVSIFWIADGCKLEGNTFETLAPHLRQYGTGCIVGNTFAVTPIFDVLSNPKYVKRNIGYVTENIAYSSAFAVDAKAYTEIKIDHGLAITPDLGDCIVELVEVTPVDDYVVQLKKISADATNITIGVYVWSNSETTGATAKLSLKVI